MAEWFSFKAPTMRGAPKGAKDTDIAPQKVVQRTFADKGTHILTIVYTPQGMWHKQITAKIGAKDAKVTTLEMPESGVILEPGAPMLPIEGLFVALPEGAELVDIKVGEVESIEFPGEVDLIPAPEPTKDSGKYDWKVPTYKQQKKIYSADKEYPKDLFKKLSVNYIGSIKIAHLMIYPLHYKPKTKKLIIYNKIEIKAEYTPGMSIPKMRGPAPGGAAEKEPVQFAAQIQRSFKSQILNLDSIEDLQTRGDGGLRRTARPVTAGKLTAIENKGRYIIITPEKLVNSLKPLAESKIAKGMSAQIVTDKQIYAEFGESGEPQFKSVHDFLLYAYDHWKEPPEYILLVGEIGKIPTYTHPDYNCPSDSYFSNLIGDISPDLIVGRIAIDDPDKLKQYIDKILAYEKAGLMKKVLFAAYERDDYMQCSDDCIDILKKIKGVKIVKKYGGQSTKAEVIKEIESGCDFINYRGHGSEWEWQSSNGLNVEDAGKLQNKGKTPIVFSICCLNNAIDVPKECFGEAFIEAANGAVAFIGASRPSYTQTNHHFDRYIFRAIVDKGLRSVGKIFNYATVELYRNFPDQYTHENIAMYLLLGDPSLEIKLPSS